VIDWPAVMVAFSIGILGGVHCVGMCGGIIGALTLSISVDNYWKRLRLILVYNLGRILSYLLIAWVFYQLVQSVQAYFALQFMRYIAGILLILMGLYLANWWQGLLYLERLGGYVWRIIQPFSKVFLPVTAYYQALGLGFIWGWLPCGLIYSALAYAAAADTQVNALLIMLAFALGTLPAVVASGLVAERLHLLVKKTRIRQGFAILIITFGVWTLVNAVSHRSHHHSISPLNNQSGAVEMMDHAHHH
jgi:uncharacterized protein